MNFDMYENRIIDLKAEVTRLRDLEAATSTRLEKADADNARLQSEVNCAQAVFDSYAKEHQQFSDRIDRLRAALEEINQHRMFIPEKQAYVELKEIARKALANEQETK
jgi:chromosome segregation ATPase